MRSSDVCLAYRWQFRLRRFYSPTGNATTAMKFLGEFKELINRGNVMDLAVAVIIGGAFTSIVTEPTTNIINPLISVVAGGSADTVSDLVVPGTEIDFGAFISACINFLIVAFVIFLLIKVVNKAQDLGNKIVRKEKEEEMPAPACPFCLEEVKEGATRCPHCAGAFDGPAKSE